MESIRNVFITPKQFDEIQSKYDLTINLENIFN